MKESTKLFIQEVKEQRELDRLHKRNTIQFSHYFKYSGKIEEYKPLREFECNKSKFVIDTESPLIRFYLENSDIPIREIARKFGYKSDGPLRKKIENYLKIRKNGKNNK
jgi:hypothetical protein|tara:strand:+ start:118 stop:444 length:327 start_codon:yes stop_codon:yes gene_type:complete